MLTDGRTDGRKVITIAHPEQSSAKLKISILFAGKSALSGDMKMFLAF